MQSRLQSPSPMTLTGALVLSLLPNVSHADLTVSFREGAPTDRFVIENDSACTIRAASILIDLSTSPAGLIFDVTAAGAGVEVYQPLRIVEGAGALGAIPEVRDGDAELRLDVATLAPGQAIAFTTDIDDTIGQREITVSGAEIAGATVAFRAAGTTAAATFSTAARATVPLRECAPGA